MELRDIDYMSEAQALAIAAENKPGPKHRQPRPDHGWANVPNWLRWFLAIDGLVIVGASIVGLVH